MTPAINAQNLRKVFRDFWHRPRVTAVQDISLSVPRGTLYGLLGPNGSGKSTTLKMLLGLLHPTDGSVQVLGAAPQDRAVQQQVGYLPEISTMYRYLTAEETLHFYGSLFDLPFAIRTQRTQELLALVGLSAAGKRPVGEFSRGMNRRLGLAQALINNPELLILDEPTAGLDPIGCHHVKTLLRKLTDTGKTVLVASHLLADIEDICSAITILHHGNVIANGTIEALLAQDGRIHWTTGEMSEKQQYLLSKSFRVITGKTPEVAKSRTNLEKYFVQSVLQAGQPQNAASTTDAAELQLPAFLQQNNDTT